MSKKLVAYFSASGVTEEVAKKLAKAAEADLFEIKPEVPYTAADLDWTNKKSRSTVEMNDPTSRPAIAEKLPNMADYDVVFVGFPSGGSGMGKTVDVLRRVAPKANFKPGKMLNRASEADMKDWVRSLGV